MQTFSPTLALQPKGHKSAAAGVEFGWAQEASLGANFLGVVEASVFFGMTTIQTNFYFGHYQNDSWVLRTSVAILWALDAVHFAAVVHFVYFSMVLNFANPAALASSPISALVLIATTAVTGVIVRGIFTYRIWRLNNQWLLASIITVLSLVNTTSSLYMTGKVANDLTYQHLRTVSWAMYLNFTAEALADILIAISLWVTLARRKTGIRSSNSMLNKLILYAVGTGALTCIMEVATLITFAVMSHTSIYNAVYLSLPKVLLNALLVSLNAREGLRRQLEGTMLSHPLSAISFKTPGGCDVEQVDSDIEFMVDNLAGELDSSSDALEIAKRHSVDV